MEKRCLLLNVTGKYICMEQNSLPYESLFKVQVVANKYLLNVARNIGVLYVVRYKSLRRADSSSRGIPTTVVCRCL